MTLQQKLTQADDYLDMLKDKAKETDKLAKENLRLRKKLDTAINVIRKDTRKIQRLKEKNEELRALYESEREVKEDYKSKVNKAINYIIEGIYSDYGDRCRDASNELLDILKGVDKQ